MASESIYQFGEINQVSTQQNQSVTELVNVSIGQRVQSAKFGIGIVIGKKGNGADEQVHVDFDGMGKSGCLSNLQS